MVVTHGWHVLCFDHNLKLLWDRSIRVSTAHMYLLVVWARDAACCPLVWPQRTSKSCPRLQAHAPKAHAFKACTFNASNLPAPFQEGLPHHAAMSEVAVHISNHTVHKGDRGLIVVGASSHLGDLSSHSGLGAPLQIIISLPGQRLRPDNMLKSPAALAVA